jgi:hypothetical protein
MRVRESWQMDRLAKHGSRKIPQDKIIARLIVVVMIIVGPGQADPHWGSTKLIEL